jgi:DNA-directed RNA polymerase specialized sigma24 family protein
MTTPVVPTLDPWDEPKAVRWTTAYLKRLLIERHAIRAKLENPGGSVIVSSTRKAETEAVTDYSAVIGNDYHLDLLDAEQVVNELPTDERLRLLLWCDGLTPQEAAQFASIRPGSLKRDAQSHARRKTLDKAVGKLNEEAGGPEQGT